MTTTETATGTARETAATAADEAKHVVQVGAEEVQNVATEAVNQVRTLVDETVTQLNEQSTMQRDRLVGTLQSLSIDLEDMASRAQNSGLATDLTRQAAQRARDLSGMLEGREPSEILDDVRGFARRRPGMFLLGAVAAGVVAGRVARGAKAAAATTGSTQYPSYGLGQYPSSGSGEYPAPVSATDPAAGLDPRVTTAEGSRIGGVRQDDPYGGTL